MPPIPLTIPPAPTEAVGPLLRGIAVLRELTDAGGYLSLGELVRATGLARSTVDRVTATLASMGYLRLDGRAAALAPRLMELGNAYLAAVRLPGLLGPHADRLADELDESVSLAVPDSDGIRFVHQATRRRAMSLTFRIGDLLPAERTAPGPLFAAQWSRQAWDLWRERRPLDPAGRGFPALPPPGESGRNTPLEASFRSRAQTAREQGWALDDQLIEPGLVAVAVPVRDGAGRTVCAASVVSHTSRHSAASLRAAMLPRLKETVAAMERDLRCAPVKEAAGAYGLADWTTVSKQELGAEFVESLARGLTVLTAFGTCRAELSLSAVSEATGLARATARRALITLEHLGYVTASGKNFRLTPKVLDLGFAPLSRTTLPRIAEPHLSALVARVHDSASLAVLAGDEIQYTARVSTSRIMSVNITVGTRFPAYATSMGRVLLAGLPPAERAARLATLVPRTQPRALTPPADLPAILDRVRHEGHALVDEELEAGLRSIGVPVRDRAGRVVAAVNVAMHSSRRSLEQCLTEVLPALRGAATRIEGDLHIAGRYARIPVL